MLCCCVCSRRGISAMICDTEITNLLFLLGPYQTRNKVYQLYWYCWYYSTTVDFPSANNRQTNMVSSDTDDDIIISSALLIASTLYQRRQVNVRKHKRNSWARKQTTDQSQLVDRARNCRRMISSNLVARLVKSWTTRDVKHDVVACLTWALKLEQLWTRKTVKNP